MLGCSCQRSYRHDVRKLSGGTVFGRATHIRQIDRAQHVAEKRPFEQCARGAAIDAARQQVEHQILIQRPGGGTVLRLDLVGIDFQSRSQIDSNFVGLAGILECIGGGLLLIGLFTRPAALLLAAEMGIAIWRVKMVHGVFAVNEYQFELALAAASVALATVGAGSLSVDHVMLGEGGTKRRSVKRDRD